MTSSTRSKEIYLQTKTKEDLYTLFYEIAGEIKGSKIIFNEEQFDENVRNFSVAQIVQYIRESVHIIIKLYHEAKNIKNSCEFSNDNLYENQLKKNENKIRYLSSEIMQYKNQIEILKANIDEYAKIEDEFDELKAKVKYEDGKFLENDRKDNEIIILRTENTNLKRLIQKSEEKLKAFDKKLAEKEKKILLLIEKNDELTKKIGAFEKENLERNPKTNSTTNLQSKTISLSPKIPHANKYPICLLKENITMKMFNPKNQKKKKNRNKSLNMVLDKDKKNFFQIYFASCQKNKNIYLNGNNSIHNSNGNKGKSLKIGHRHFNVTQGSFNKIANISVGSNSSNSDKKKIVFHRKSNEKIKPSSSFG